MNSINGLLPNADDRVSEKLPAYMNYSMKDVAPPCENSRYFLSPINGSTFVSNATSGPIMSFALQCGTPSTYLNTLETTLVFTISNTTNVAMTLDAGGALALIESCDIYFGSSHLSSVQAYGNLCNTLSDFTSFGNHSIRGVADVVMPATYTATTAQSALKVKTGQTIAASSTLTVAIPLLNLLGSLSQKAIPIGMLKDSLRIDLRLAGGLSWGTYPSAPTTNLYTIVNPRLWLTEIRLDGQVENALISSLPNGIIHIPTFDIQSFSTSINANCGAWSYQIPIKCSSLCSVIVTMRETVALGKHNYSDMQRTKATMESYRFRIGSRLIPSTPIDCTGSACESFMELKRCLNQLALPENPSYIDAGLYIAEGASGGAIGSTTQGCFAFGLNLSALAMSEVLSDGRNVRNEYITIDSKMVSATSQALMVNIYCFQEKLLVVQNGLLTYSD